MNDINIVQLDDFKKKHIAILCLPGLEGFLGDIIEELRKKYRVTTCYSKSIPELETAMRDADLIWLEFCNELVVELTRNSKILETKKVIVRLHSYEALSGYVQHIRWQLIDTIIFVCAHIHDITVKQLPGLLDPALNPPKMIVVPNGVAI